MKKAMLKSSFMAISIIGFMTSAIYISQFSATWAFTFGTVFAIMFAASMISVGKNPEEINTWRQK